MSASRAENELSSIEREVLTDVPMGAIGSGPHPHARTDGDALPTVELSVADQSTQRLDWRNAGPDRGFWNGLGAATALHAVLLLGIGHAAPRHVGELDGSADGISVSVVTEAELRGEATVAEPATPPPGRVAPPPSPPRPPSKPEPPSEAATAEPAAQPAEPVERPAEQPTPVELKPAQLPEAPAPSPSPNALQAALEKDTSELLALRPSVDVPKPKAEPAKPAEAQVAKPMPVAPQAAQPKPIAPQPQPKRVAKLDLTPPQPSFAGPSGGGGRRAGMERPPGITRSGANDEFARGVIRALQGTMPQLREVLGRVTVRITLNENGNVSDVQVVNTANNATIDQSVVFAAKQTSYPFPPPNSNLADRTFLVTYIYH
jgi:periplasmic protein TonB